MKKIEVKVFEDMAKSNDTMKSLALLVYLKNEYVISVIPNFSYYKIAKSANIHQSTAKKYINILINKGYASREGKYNQHLKIKRVRGIANISIAKLENSKENKQHITYKEVCKGLYATIIVLIQSRKDYIQHQVFQATGKSKCSVKEYKRSRRLCTSNRWIGQKSDGKGYYSNYKDNGISYNHICNKYNIGRSKVSGLIKFGERNNMFKKKNNIEQVFVKGAKRALPYLRDNGYTFATKNNLYTIKANTYILCS